MSDIKQKPKSRKLFLSILVLIILVAVTVYFLMRNYDIDEIVASLGKMDYRHVLLGVSMLFLFILFGAFAVKTVAGPLGSRTGILKAIKYSCVDIYFSGITPAATGGQPFVTYYMKKDGIPIYRSTIVILMTTMTYKIVLVIFGVLGYIFFPQIYFDTNAAVTSLSLFGLSINVILIILCAFGMFSKKMSGAIGSWMIKFLGKIKVIKNPQKRLDSFDQTLNNYSEAARFIKENKSVMIKTLACSFLQRTALFSVSYFVYRGLGFDAMNALEIISLQAAISLCVDSIPLPGAAGVTELAFIMLYGRAYPNEDVRATALLITRGITYYLGVIVSGLVVLLSHIKGMALRKEE